MRYFAALILMIATTVFATGTASAADCDRECLRGKVTEVLWALADHDVASLAVSGDLRVTEDGVEKPLAQLGLARTVTKLQGYRQDIIDERAGQAVAGVMVEESGAPILLVVRVKVDGNADISEIELVTTRSLADGMIYSIEAYEGAPAKQMTYVPTPNQLESREEAIRLGMYYPRGLSNAETFNAIGTPFSEDAFRLENGRLMAGPGCTFAPGCEDIGNQSLQIFNQLGRVTVRDIVVDERLGIVIMRLHWNQRGTPDSAKLTAWEMFKVYDGQIHMVQAYIRLFPPELALGGWPIRAEVEQPAGPSAQR